MSIYFLNVGIFCGQKLLNNLFYYVGFEDFAFIWDKMFQQIKIRKWFNCTFTSTNPISKCLKMMFYFKTGSTQNLLVHFMYLNKQIVSYPIVKNTALLEVHIHIYRYIHRVHTRFYPFQVPKNWFEPLILFKMDCLIRALVKNKLYPKMVKMYTKHPNFLHKLCLDYESKLDLL